MNEGKIIERDVTMLRPSAGNARTHLRRGAPHIAWRDFFRDPHSIR